MHILQLQEISLLLSWHVLLKFVHLFFPPCVFLTDYYLDLCASKRNQKLLSLVWLYEEKEIPEWTSPHHKYHTFPN